MLKIELDYGWRIEPLIEVKSKSFAFAQARSFPDILTKVEFINIPAYKCRFMLNS